MKWKRITSGTNDSVYETADGQYQIRKALAGYGVAGPEWRLLRRDPGSFGGWEWQQTFRLLRDAKHAADAITRKDNPMPESLTLSAAKLDAFVKAVNSATPHKLEEMIKRCQVEANDYAHPPNIRAIYRKLATLLRNELKGWKRNPVKKKTASKKKAPRKKRASNPRRGVGSYELSAAWGDEYNNLTAREKDALLRDFMSATVAEGMTADEMADEYVRRIYRGNLKSYVKMLLAVPKGRASNPRKKRDGFIVLAGKPSGQTTYLAHKNVGGDNIFAWGKRADAHVYRDIKIAREQAKRAQRILASTWGDVLIVRETATPKTIRDFLTGK